MPSASRDRQLLTTRVVAALAAVYLIWGSTYLGLRFALESFPPFLLGGTRYLLAGALLYLGLRVRGQPAPPKREWGAALLLGILYFLLGNGLVAVAQRSISSSVAAIVVATTSLWAVLFEAFWGARPRASELVGLCLGLSGIALLQHGGAFEGTVTGFVAITLAPMAWALGTVLSRHIRSSSGSMAPATQMIAGGLAMLALSTVRGEQISVVTPRALLAFAYLVVFGSLVAFSAFTFLLRSTRPAIATSCAFVNPVVALILGSVWGAETLTVIHWVACGLSGLGVLFVLRTRVPK